MKCVPQREESTAISTASVPQNGQFLQALNVAWETLEPRAKVVHF